MPTLSYNNKRPKRETEKFANVAHLVERHLAKVEVASSSLVVRSICEMPRSECAPHAWGAHLLCPRLFVN